MLHQSLIPLASSQKYIYSENYKKLLSLHLFTLYINYVLLQSQKLTEIKIIL